MLFIGAKCFVKELDQIVLEISEQGYYEAREVGYINEKFKLVKRIKNFYCLCLEE